MPADNVDLSRLLQAWGGGDDEAFRRLAPLVYEQLRQLAHNQMRRERPGHALQTTALVHEAYLRLATAGGREWQNRSHFFALAARLMRRILVDTARAEATTKRGGHMARVDHPSGIDFDRFAAPGSDPPAEMCALDDALTALASIDPRRAQVIEMRFFGGLSVEETADALGVSPQTVMRDWRLARAWLTRELNG